MVISMHSMVYQSLFVSLKQNVVCKLRILWRFAVTPVVWLQKRGTCALLSTCHFLYLPSTLVYVGCEIKRYTEHT